MIFTRKIEEFYRLNHRDIVHFIVAHTRQPNDEKIKEISQSFYLYILQSKSLEKYDPLKGKFSTYIYAVLVWTMGRNFHLLKPLTYENLDDYEETLEEKPVENPDIILDDYLKWIKATHKKYLPAIIKYLNKRKKDAPTMHCRGYAIHKKCCDEYLNLG